MYIYPTEQELSLFRNLVNYSRMRVSCTHDSASEPAHQSPTRILHTVLDTAQEESLPIVRGCFRNIQQVGIANTREARLRREKFGVLCTFS
jgi:hypothetical protein